MLVMSRQNKADGVLGFSLVMAVALAVLAAKSLIGCGGAAAPALSATAYEAEQLACIVEAGTKQAADDCRCAIQARYGRVCTMTLDGGAR